MDVTKALDTRPLLTTRLLALPLLFRLSHHHFLAVQTQSQVGMNDTLACFDRMRVTVNLFALVYSQESIESFIT